MRARLGAVGVAAALVVWPASASATCESQCDDAREEPSADPPLLCSEVSLGFSHCGCAWHFVVENRCAGDLEVLDLPLTLCGDFRPGPEGCTTVHPGDEGARPFTIESNGRIERTVHIRDDDGEHEVKVALTVRNYREPDGCQLSLGRSPAWSQYLWFVPALALRRWARRRRCRAADAAPSRRGP